MKISFSLYQQICFLVREWTLLWLNSNLSIWTTSGLNLCRTYACCHSICEYICTPVQLCLEETVCSYSNSLWLLEPSLPSFCHRSLRLEARGLISTPHFELSAPKSFTLYTLASLGASVNYHLLKQDYLMMAKWGMIYEYSNTILFFHFLLLCSFSKIIIVYFLLGLWGI